MDKPDLYSTFNTFEELEKRKFEALQFFPESVLFRMQQLLLDACVNEKGVWSGNNPFHDLEMLCAIAQDNIDHAKRFLDDPEKTRAIRENAMICVGFKKIREELAKRFRGDGRE